MARTAADIEARIAELEQKRANARSWAARDLMRERLSYLKGELMLQREKERQALIAEPTDEERYLCEDGAKQ